MYKALPRLRAVGVAVALSLTVGLFGAAAPAASAAPTVATQATARTVTISPTAATSTGASDRVVVQQVKGSSAATTAGQQLRIKIPTSVLKKIISYIVKYAKISYTKLKSIVKAGYAEFKKLWNKLPGWVRFIISNLAGGSAYEVFKALWDYFF